MTYLDAVTEPTYLSRPCPICGKLAAARDRPFCSPRCKDVDLNRWLSGRYVIAAAESDDDAGEGKDALRNREGD